MKDFRPGDPASGIASAYAGSPLTYPSRPPRIEDLLALVERITATRNGRKDFLDTVLFAEPGWDMLVQLFHADLVGYRLTISNLALASGVPLTTALRWMDILQDKGLAVRCKNPFDGRSTFIEITVGARAQMYDYLCKTWTTYYA